MSSLQIHLLRRTIAQTAARQGIAWNHSTIIPVYTLPSQRRRWNNLSILTNSIKQRSISHCCPPASSFHTGAIIDQPSFDHSTPCMHDQWDHSTKELHSLLSAHFPMEQFEFVATYGSAAFQQVTEEEQLQQTNQSSTPPPTTDEQPMLDLIFAVRDPIEFHQWNMARNPSHYSFLKHLSGWDRVLTFIQEFGAGVWYNTLIPLPIPGQPGQTKLIKYGVVSTERLIQDLHQWDSLYLAGRMHKPMNILHSTAPIQTASQENLRHALRTTLLLLDTDTKNKQYLTTTPDRISVTTPIHETGRSFFTVLASLSYGGDIRMGLAENPRKVEKIVIGNWQDLIRLYRTPMKEILGKEVQLQSWNDMIDFQCDETRRSQLVQQLPQQVQLELVASDPSIRWNKSSSASSSSSSSSPLSPLLSAFTRMSQPQAHQLLATALGRIVARSSTLQTMKGLLTAGFIKSIRYGWAKMQKARKK